MIVMKFGGTSVGTPASIQNVYKIVADRLDQTPIVVVSAVGGVTDLLLEASQAALKGKISIDKILQKHNKIVDELNLDGKTIEPLHEELIQLLNGIKMIREISPKTSDYLVSFGERISCQLVSAYFEQKGMRSKPHFAFDIGMETDSNFQEAQPTTEAFEKIRKHLSKIDYVPVVTGFIGKNENGEITTLGRGGSDYSAAIIGAAVQSKEIQIWTDVDGILTTDPRVVKQAQNIPMISFTEAAELAYFGAKVLHPKTIRPAMDKNIPVVVKNTSNHSHSGTRILKNVPKTKGSIKAFSVKKDISLINIYSLGMLDAFGFLSKIFAIFAKYEVVVDVVTTSEVSVSVTVKHTSKIEAVLEELSEFAQVKVEHQKAIVCAVGEGMRNEIGLAGRLFSVLGQQEISIQMISQGSSEVNITFVIQESQAEKAIQALHAEFFES